MEELIILILLVLGTLVLVLPIVAVVKAGRARRQTEELAEQVRSLGLEITTLKRKVAEGVPAVSSQVPPPAAAPTPAAPVEVPPVAVSAPPPPLPEVEPAPVFASTAAATPPTVPPPIPDDLPPTLPPAPPPVAAEPTPAFNWEQFVGVKLFAWIAGIGLLCTAVFFLKYSFDHNWIPESARAALGFLTGAGLIVGGLWSIRRNYAATGQSLTATGIVVLYAVTIACRLYYRFEFFDAAATGVLLALITLTAFLLAVRLEAQVVAVLGLLGGFATPMMLSTGHDNPPGLFGFIALLDLGILAVALHRRWFYLTALAALGTVFMEIGWAGKFFELAKLPTAVTVLVVFNALFAIAVLVARRLGRASDWLASAAVLPPFVALCFSFYFAFMPAVAARAGWVLGNILLADLALLGVCALHRSFSRLSLAAGLATFGVAAVWIGAAVDDALLPWALGFVVVAAALHTVFPFVQERLEPGTDQRLWSAFFPPLALLVLLLPFAQMDDVGWWLWPAVLVINLFALVAAALTRLFSALAASLLVTLLVLGVAIAQLPSGFTGGGREILLVAGFSVFFCAGALWLLRRFGGSLEGSAPDWSAYLPDATAGLPFLLLLMLVYKLEQTDPSMIFGVVLLLNVLLFGIAVIARRGAPVLAAFAGTLLIEYSWWDSWAHLGDKGIALVWFFAFALGFLTAPFVFRRRIAAIQPPWAVAALSLPLHFTLLHRTILSLYPNDFPGLIPALCVLPPLVGLVVLLRTIPNDAPYRLNRLAWFGGATLFFITLVFPIQFSAHWITIGWALEGAALLWLYHRIPHPGLRLVGVGLLTATFARLILNPAVLHYAERSPTPIFNWILGTYGCAALCCFAGMRLLAPPRDRVLGCNAPAILATFGTILAFALVNFEIADYFTAEGAWVNLEFSGNIPRDMSYTIAWGIFALVLLVAGIRQRLRAVRYAAIALLGVTCIKLFLHDTANLETIWRISAFAVVSILTLAASFLFARFLRSSEQSKS